jgi:hypothetical protein
LAVTLSNSIAPLLCRYCRCARIYCNPDDSNQRSAPEAITYRFTQP